MTKINNTTAYPIKQYPTMKDFFVGSDNEDGDKTVNFAFEAVSNMILGDIEYIFSLSTNPLSAPNGNGYFITNGVVDFSLITTLQISKINLSGVNLTQLMNFMGSNVTEFNLKITSKNNKNIFAYLTFDNITESTDYFTYDVSLAPGNNFLGQLVDNDVYSFDYVLNTSINTLPVASETTPGIVELATAAETIAGTDNTRAVHPFGLAAALALLQKTLSLTTNTNSGAATLIANILNIPRYDLYADSKIQNAINNGITTIGASQNAIFAALLLKVDKTQLINTSGPLQGGGNLSGTLNLSILQASASQSGYLSAADWVIFNNKSNANGTVTEVLALVLGSTGTDINASILNGTTQPQITLNIPTASAIKRGLLSPADWATFNSKQSTSLLANNIFVGNASNIATGVLLSGDANINSAGVLTNTGLYGKPITLAVGFFKYNGTDWVFDNSTYLVAADITGKEDIANKTDDIEGNKTSSIKYITPKSIITWSLDYLVTNIPAKATALLDADKILIGDSADSNKTKTIPSTSLITYIKTKLETEISYACSDESSDLTVGTLITFRMPFGMTLTKVKLSLNTAPTASKVIVDVKKGGVSIFSTLISVDTSQTTSVGASVPYVISDPNLTDDSIITIITTQIGSANTGKGLKVTFLGTRT